QYSTGTKINQDCLAALDEGIDVARVLIQVHARDDLTQLYGVGLRMRKVDSGRTDLRRAQTSQKYIDPAQKECHPHCHVAELPRGQLHFQSLLSGILPIA